MLRRWVWRADPGAIPPALAAAVTDLGIPHASLLARLLWNRDVREADVLAPPAALHGQFDLVWEQTCLCALPPEERRPYLQAMAQLLGPGGRMVALLWNHGNEGGPPWDMSPVLVERLLVGLFTIDRRERVSESIAERVGDNG